MASINISLSDELKRYVEDQVKGGSYGNVSEFIRSLLRDQQKREAQERLELLLLEGIASGSDGPMTKTDWQELRKVRREYLHPTMKSLRFWCVPHFFNILIFYREHAGTVEIVRLLHSSRDIDFLLYDPEEE
jgi:antitoxin ParD1/3/4